MKCWTNFEKVHFIQKDEENRWKKIGRTENTKNHIHSIYMVEANPKKKKFNTERHEKSCYCEQQAFCLSLCFERSASLYSCAFVYVNRICNTILSCFACSLWITVIMIAYVLLYMVLIVLCVDLFFFLYVVFFCLLLLNLWLSFSLLTFQFLAVSRVRCDCWAQTLPHSQTT